jgi:hypothetical protein
VRHWIVSVSRDYADAWDSAKAFGEWGFENPSPTDLDALPQSGWMRTVIESQSPGRAGIEPAWDFVMDDYNARPKPAFTDRGVSSLATDRGPNALRHAARTHVP